MKALLLLLLASPAPAQLAWESTRLEFHSSPEEKQVVSGFRFQNKGPAPVTIKSVKTGCGCLDADVEKKTYAPGESGVVRAVFTFGNRKGGYHKIVTVTLEDGTQQELHFIQYIEDPLTLSTSLLLWRQGQPAAAQEVVLTASAGKKVRVTGATCSNPRFAARLEQIEEGTRYRVIVQPTDTSQRESADLVIQTDSPPAAPQSYTLHARIK